MDEDRVSRDANIIYRDAIGIYRKGIKVNSTETPMCLEKENEDRIYRKIIRSTQIRSAKTPMTATKSPVRFRNDNAIDRGAS